MAGNNKLNLDDSNDGSLSDAEQRIQDLSTKVKLTSKERDELAEANKTVTSERDAARKETDFYKGFSAVSGTYPASSEHVEEIKTKVLAGYTVEDATVSVLNKAGKLVTKPPEKDSVAGGSATNPPPKLNKEIKDMNREELRAAVVEAANRGDIGVE